MSVTLPVAFANAALDAFFADNSFVSGAEATSADAEVFQALSAAPDAAAFPNAARWYSHIASKGDAVASLKAPEAAAAPAAAAEEAADEDDIDLFGSDEEEDEEAERLKAERLAEYQAKKAAKGPGPAAKSAVTLEIKTWDSDTDLDELERLIKEIQMDGLVWGVKGEKIAVAYGIFKLRINITIEDAKVSTDDLIDKICELEDYVQSVDILAFMKL
ncbi:Translation elongation factor 1 beta [Coemansia sp. Benny D115]|nr:Translation elongation factor 1 beta [Coemansia sp. Benny D115]